MLRQNHRNPTVKENIETLIKNMTSQTQQTITNKIHENSGFLTLTSAKSPFGSCCINDLFFSIFGSSRWCENNIDIISSSQS